MTGASDAERDRLAGVYADYAATATGAARWDTEHPGHARMLEERHRALVRLLGDIPTPSRVLEVGCGAGTVLAELAEILPGATRIGADLLADRLDRAALAAGHTPVLQADGRVLPFPDRSVDLVVTCTVFSSILDADVRTSVASEIDRVLRPGGHLLWYDLRRPSPNPDVRPLPAAAVRDLLPGYEGALRPITLLPPLARTIARHPAPYATLARIPLLRSHLLALLRKPPSD